MADNKISHGVIESRSPSGARIVLSMMCLVITGWNAARPIPNIAEPTDRPRLRLWAVR